MWSEEVGEASGPRRGAVGSFSKMLGHCLPLSIISSPIVYDMMSYNDSGQVEVTPLPSGGLIIYFPEAQQQFFSLSEALTNLEDNSPFGLQETSLQMVPAFRWRASQVVLSPAGSGDMSLILGSGRSVGAGNSNPIQYSCWENPKDRAVLWAIVHRVSESRT